jgi:hypothetical protein
MNRRLAARSALAPLIAVAGVAGILALTACAPLDRALGLRGVACASWVAFTSDEERAESADAVVIVTDIVPDGTVDIMGYDANAYRVTVIDVEKGDLVVPSDPIRVGSTADACSAHPYGESGDQMLQGDPLRLYLDRGDDIWTTLTPFDGAHLVDERDQPTR